jgi:hypothetical protein
MTLDWAAILQQHFKDPKGKKIIVDTEASVNQIEISFPPTTDEELQGFIKEIKKINPDEVEILTIDSIS